MGEIGKMTKLVFALVAVLDWFEKKDEAFETWLDGLRAQRRWSWVLLSTLLSFYPMFVLVGLRWYEEHRGWLLKYHLKQEQNIESLLFLFIWGLYCWKRNRYETMRKERDEAKKHNNIIDCI